MTLQSDFGKFSEFSHLNPIFNFGGVFQTDHNYKKKLKKFTDDFRTKLNTGNKIEGDQKIKGATAPPYCYNYCIIETLRWQSTLKAIFVPSI